MWLRYKRRASRDEAYAVLLEATVIVMREQHRILLEDAGDDE